LGIKGRFVDDLLARQWRTPKMLCIDEIENIQKALPIFAERFANRLRVSMSSVHYIEINDIDSNKGLALEKLAGMLGLGQEEIIAVARRIGTFDLSTLPYNDCCTVFTPRHPRTRPKLPQVLKAEEVLELAEFERSAAERAASEIIAPGRDRPMPV